MKHAKRSGWRPFWAALCAALLVLLPLVGGTVLLSRAQLRSSLRQAAKSQSGVPIRLPKATDRCTVLLCVADETPGFVLAYLNAGQNCIHMLAVPAALEVPFGGKNVPLADCYAAAGPARCREALGEVFALPEDTDYLAIAPAVLTKLAARYGAVRVGFTGALTPEQLARYGKGTGVQGISAADAHSFLAALDADTSLSHRRPGGGVGCVFPAGAGVTAHHPAAGAARSEQQSADQPDRRRPCYTGTHAGIFSHQRRAGGYYRRRPARGLVKRALYGVRCLPGGGAELFQPLPGGGAVRVRQ